MGSEWWMICVQGVEEEADRICRQYLRCMRRSSSSSPTRPWRGQCQAPFDNNAER